MLGILKKLLLVLMMYPLIIGAEKHKEIFSTWDGFELDKCASIWLIKRFVSLDAKINFYEKGEIIKEGIPFDTPDAKFRRYHNRSTFETLLSHYELNDRELDYIGRIVHDVEVNIWEQKAVPETSKIQSDIQAIILQDDRATIIKDCLSYFDDFYDGLKANGSKSGL